VPYLSFWGFCVLGTTCHLFCFVSLPLFVEVLFLMGCCGPLGFCACGTLGAICFFSVVPPAHHMLYLLFHFVSVVFVSLLAASFFCFQHHQICLFCDGLVDCCFDPSTGLVPFLFERWLNRIGLYCHCLGSVFDGLSPLCSRHIMCYLFGFVWALLLLQITYIMFHCNFIWCYLCYSLVLFQLWLWSWYPLHITWWWLAFRYIACHIFCFNQVANPRHIICHLFLIWLVAYSSRDVSQRHSW